MRTWVAASSAAIATAALAAGATLGLAARRWQGETSRLLHELTNLATTQTPARTDEHALAAASPLARAAPRTERAALLHEPASGGGLVSFAALGALPAVVEHYFRSVLSDGQLLVETARFAQTGRFNMNEVHPAWRAFDAEQAYRVTPPGFVWDAHIHMAPFIDVWVRDAYVAQRGSLRVAVLGVADVANERDTPELSEGELQRYLAEAPMFPTALLPAAGVSWNSLDDTHAVASITNGATTAALTFEFATSGEIVAVSAERYRAENGGYVRTPWFGRYRRYEAVDGMRVPMQAEVGWILDGRPTLYITLDITSARYNFHR